MDTNAKPDSEIVRELRKTRRTLVTTIIVVATLAAIGLLGVWAKLKLDAWDEAWRSSEAEASAISSADSALAESDYAAAQSRSPSMAAAQETLGNLNRIENDEDKIIEIEQRTIAILEHKPFGLPLTATERKELTSLKEDLKKGEEEEPNKAH